MSANKAYVASILLSKTLAEALEVINVSISAVHSVDLQVPLFEFPEDPSGTDIVETLLAACTEVRPRGTSLDFDALYVAVDGLIELCKAADMVEAYALQSMNEKMFDELDEILGDES